MKIISTICAFFLYSFSASAQDTSFENITPVFALGKFPGIPVPTNYNTIIKINAS